MLTVVGGGSGSYGSVLAWSASKGHTLVPIYRNGDSTSKSTGGTRSIDYKKVNDEASS